MYVPLWVKTNYSFLQGASHPEELVEQAHSLGLPALAITDRDGIYGVVRAHMQAQQKGLKLLLGAQVTVGQGDAAEVVVLLAQDRAGYGHLCQLLSLGQQRCAKGEAWITVQELQKVGPGVLALCPAATLLPGLLPAFQDRLYALCVRHQVAEEQHVEARLVAQSQRLGIPIVAAQEVLYHHETRRPLQDILTCIRHTTCIQQAGTRLRANSEHALKPVAAMQHLFADRPEWLQRTLEVAQRCSFGLQQLHYRYPTNTHASDTPQNRLTQLTWAGAQTRYGKVLQPEIGAQINKELQLIQDLDYGGYFLTMYEIVQFCHQQNILCQGRGSAANSVVCYVLGITAIDPIRLGFLFERFISRERAEPPDIDLDIEHQRREEVIQWLYQRYDRRHAAMVANVIRFRMRSAVREVSKALGLPADAVDRLAKILSAYDAGLDAKTLELAGLKQAPIYAHMLRLAHEILDFPRHLSIHPGGFLLGHEPVDTLVPIEPATMENRTVIQWDKQDIEDLGLFKVDLLGLGSLSHIHGCFELIAGQGGPQLTMANVPAECPAAYNMMCRGDTVGVFQIESRAQMSMLPRLKPKTFYDLVVEVALVRPGPIQGNMVHPYLQRRENPKLIEYPHPSFKVALEKTFGVPIFQEQVMKIAMLVAGYSPGEADQLRRDMAAWRSAGRIEQHHDRLVGRMMEHGVPQEFAENIFAQVRGFGEYGFPESHAASFALLAYITAWLKCHHPAAFTCALLNAQPMGFYSAGTLIEDAKRHQVPIFPIDINHSAWDSTLQRADADTLGIRVGLRCIKGFGTPEQTALQAQPPPYACLDDLVRRTGLKQKSLLALAEAGALQSLGLLRRDALWAVRGLVTTRQDSLPLPSQQAPQQFTPLSQNEAVLWDYRTSFHSARGHPMQTLRPQLQKRRIPAAAKLVTLPADCKTSYVGLVICRQRPQTASGVVFMTLEDETGMVNAVVWKQVFEAHVVIAKTATLLGITGTLQRASGVVHLVAQSLWIPDMPHARLALASRDFH